jgi:allantoinase
VEKYDLIIRNGKIVTEQGTNKGDIGILGGEIVEISPKISRDIACNQEIDIEGLYILPGLIDVHVHLNEPGRIEWEGIETGSRALAAGGATTFFDMPLNSDPPTLTPVEFMEKKKLADEKSVIDYGLLGGLVPENINSLEELKDCGAIGFKGFMPHSGINEFSAIDGNELFIGLKKVAKLESIAMLHAESQVITTHLALEALVEGKTTAKDFEASRPIASEVEAVERALAMAEVTKSRIHIVHASSSEVVNRVSIAKTKGVDATVETCPHYLALTVDDLEKLGPIAKCAPPVRYKKDVDALWEALANGDIDIIASDHSPSPPEMKELVDDKNIFNCWGGISSAQSTLNVLLEEGYWKRGLPLETIVEVTSSNPARRFGLYPVKGTISVGSDADLAIVDLNSEFILRKEDLFYRHSQSPFIGKKFRGKVILTFVRGNKVFENGEVVDNGFRGRMVKKVTPK